MKPFAIYFPQFYPTQTNDNAWGHGFTDWSLVANANLNNKWVRRAPKRGFYDGSSPNTHKAQIEEMVNFNLGGVAIYHYWFYSHQELNAFEKSVLDKKNIFPWFLIWATEGWSKRWLGDSSEIIRLTPNPSDKEISQHCDYLETCFESNSYLKINNKPLFLIYNISHFSNPENTISKYRNYLSAKGIEVTIGHFIKNPFDIKYSKIVDVSYLFEPRLFFGTQRSFRGSKTKIIHDVAKKIIGEEATKKIISLADPLQQKGATFSAPEFIKYLSSDTRNKLINQINTPVQDVLSPGWNNTPRYSNRFTALDNIDPKTFSNLIAAAKNKCHEFPPLINAWNEWSEGAAIEPCAYLGNSYLEEISKISQ